MDYGKLAREILYDEFIPKELHSRLVAGIAQALERAGLEARIDELDRVYTDVGFYSTDERLKALRKRLEELNARAAKIIRAAENARK
jgi:hypothetical protein